MINELNLALYAKTKCWLDAAVVVVVLVDRANASISVGTFGHVSLRPFAAFITIIWCGSFETLASLPHFRMIGQVSSKGKVCLSVSLATNITTRIANRSICTHTYTIGHTLLNSILSMICLITVLNGDSTAIFIYIARCCYCVCVSCSHRIHELITKFANVHFWATI